MIELYYRTFCPYSRKVREFISQQGLEHMVKMYEIGRDREAMIRLKAMVGGQQVPCLVVDGKPLLESDVITGWLAQHVRPAAGSMASGDGFRRAPVTSPAASY